MNWDHKELKATVKTSEILQFLGCQTRLVVPGAGAYLECLSEDHRSWGNVVMPLCSFSSMDLLCFIYFLLLRMHSFMLICQLTGVTKCVLSGTLTVFVVLAAKCSQKAYFVFISCALLYTFSPPPQSSSNLKWGHVHCGLKCQVALPVFKGCHIFPLPVAGVIVTSGANLRASRIAGP